MSSLNHRPCPPVWGPVAGPDSVPSGPLTLFSTRFPLFTLNLPQCVVHGRERCFHTTRGVSEPCPSGPRCSVTRSRRESSVCGTCEPVAAALSRLPLRRALATDRFPSLPRARLRWGDEGVPTVPKLILGTNEFTDVLENTREGESSRQGVYGRTENSSVP